MSKDGITRRNFIDTGAIALGAAGLAAGAGQANAEKRTLNVKYGLNLLLYTATFSKDSVDMIKKVADMGYDGVEIPFNDLSVLDAKATRKAREAAGIGLTSCVILMPGTSITSADPDERKAGIKRLRDVVDITAEMGGDVASGPIYVPLGQLSGKGRTDDEFKWAVECMRVAAEHAEKMDVVLGVEPLNRFETHVFNTAADTTKFVAEVGHRKVKVHLDTFHCNIEEKDTPSAIRATGKHLGHFHASESDRGTPGTGQVDWKGCFSALRDVNYSGWVTIESFAIGIVDLCAAACIWRPIYKSGDDLAINGLAFLKSMERSV